MLVPTIELPYIVEWLNFWLKNDLPLAKLIEQRVEVPSAVEGLDDSTYPLILSPTDTGGAAFGALSLLSSLAESVGCRVVAVYDHLDILTKFKLVQNETYNRGA